MKHSLHLDQSTLTQLIIRIRMTEKTQIYPGKCTIHVTAKYGEVILDLAPGNINQCILSLKANK